MQYNPPHDSRLLMAEGDMKLIYRNQTWELRGGMTVRDAIRKVGLDPDAVLALRDGVLINEETILAEDDVIKLVAVVSGG